MSETEYIGQSLSKIRIFARKNNVAVFVVAHPKSMAKDASGNYPVPNPYDISGSANWRNKADNCIAVWRDLADDTQPVAIHIQKIKFKICGKLGVAQLKYDRLTGRYFDSTTGPAPMFSRLSRDNKTVSAGDETYVDF
jgi:twinkle protein